MSTNQEKSLEVINYLFFYYLFIFLSVIGVGALADITDLLRNNFLLQWALIGICDVVLFFIQRLLQKRQLTLVSLLTNCIIDLTFLLRLVLIFRTKIDLRIEFDAKNLFHIWTKGVFLFLFMFGTVGVCSLIGINVQNILEIITGVLNTVLQPKLIPSPTLNPYQESLLLLQENVLYLGELLITSPLLYNSFGPLLTNSLVVAPIFFHSFFNNTYNLIAPHGILEILGVSLAAGAGFLIQYYILLLLTLKKEEKKAFKLYSSFILKVIILTSLLSLWSCVLAWAIESYTLINTFNGSSLPLKWFQLIYVYDLLILIDYALILYNLFKYQNIILTQLYTYFVYSFILLFSLVASYNGFKYANSIFTFIFFVLCFFAILKDSNSFYILSYYKTGNTFGDFQLMPLNGSSMYPTLERTDILVVYTNVNDIEPKISDIVCWKPPLTYTLPIPSIDPLITHRIIQTYDDGKILTQGDNVNRADGRIAKTAVKGLVIAKIDPILYETSKNIEKLTDRTTLYAQWEGLIPHNEHSIKMYVHKISSIHAHTFYRQIIVLIIGFLVSFIVVYLLP